MFWVLERFIARCWRFFSGFLIFSIIWVITVWNCWRSSKILEDSRWFFFRDFLKDNSRGSFFSRGGSTWRQRVTWRLAANYDDHQSRDASTNPLSSLFFSLIFFFSFYCGYCNLKAKKVQAIIDGFNRLIWLSNLIIFAWFMQRFQN